jgi:hypothetical protein
MRHTLTRIGFLAVESRGGLNNLVTAQSQLPQTQLRIDGNRAVNDHVTRVGRRDRSDENDLHFFDRDRVYSSDWSSAG